MGTAAANGSRRNGDDGAAALRRLFGSWTGEIPGEENGLEKIYPTLSPTGYGATALEVDKPEAWGRTCVSADEKYGGKVSLT
jgi:hypothetical protein